MYRKRSNMVKQYPKNWVSPCVSCVLFAWNQLRQTSEDFAWPQTYFVENRYPMVPPKSHGLNPLNPNFSSPFGFPGTVPVQRRAGDPISQRWLRFVQAPRGNSAVHFCGVLSLSRCRLFCHFWRWGNSWLFDSFCCFSYWVCENRALANVRFPTN